MGQIGAMLWDMKGHFIAGGIVLGIGAAIFVAGRSMGPDIARTTRWFAYPAMGCGGCLLVYPLFVTSGALLMAWGIVAFCRNSAGC